MNDHSAPSKVSPQTHIVAASMRNVDILITPATLFTIAWLLMMILIPIIGWVGEDYFEIGVMAGVLLQAATVLTILWQAWGASMVVRLVLLILPLTWLLEFIGSRYGVPFSAYHYTDLLNPQLGGVPIIIPIAWLMMLPVSWSVATAILEDKTRSAKSLLHIAHNPYDTIRFSILSGLAMTAWDLFLDPQMVGWGYWVWENPGGYFGIPWLNFGGWWISSTLITFLVITILKPQTLPIKPLLIIYVIVWLLQSVGQALFWSQPGPAIVGFFGMGILVWSASAGLRTSELNVLPS